jgi:hypothetical protein
MSQTIKDWQEFHPRAVKLLRKRKEFLVVASDEPYVGEVWRMIRGNELRKNTWTNDDEMRYRAAQLLRATRRAADDVSPRKKV